MDERDADLERFLDGFHLSKLEDSRWRDDLYPDQHQAGLRVRRHVRVAETKAVLSRRPAVPDAPSAEDKAVAAAIKRRVMARLHGEPPPAADHADRMLRALTKPAA